MRPGADLSHAREGRGGPPAGTGRHRRCNRLGLLVPAYTSDTTYVGQYSETYNWAQKTLEANTLLNGGGDLPAFLADHHVRYVIWSAADTSAAPPELLGTPAFSAPGVLVFALY